MATPSFQFLRPKPWRFLYSPLLSQPICWLCFQNLFRVWQAGCLRQGWDAAETQQAIAAVRTPRWLQAESEQTLPSGKESVDIRARPPSLDRASRGQGFRNRDLSTGQAENPCHPLLRGDSLQLPSLTQESQKQEDVHATDVDTRQARASSVDQIPLLLPQGLLWRLERGCACKGGQEAPVWRDFERAGGGRVCHGGPFLKHSIPARRPDSVHDEGQGQQLPGLVS